MMDLHRLEACQLPGVFLLIPNFNFLPSLASLSKANHLQLQSCSILTISEHKNLLQSLRNVFKAALLSVNHPSLPPQRHSTEKRFIQNHWQNLSCSSVSQIKRSFVKTEPLTNLYLRVFFFKYHGSFGSVAKLLVTTKTTKIPTS